MPLQWTSGNLPALGGIDQLIDGVLLSPPGASLISNLRPVGAGRLAHRYGFTALNPSIENSYITDPSSLSQTKIKSIFSSGDSLCIHTDDFLYTYEGDTNGWLERGNPPPGTLEQLTIQGSVGSTGIAQMVEIGDYIVMAWQQAKFLSNGVLGDTAVWTKVVHKNGDVHIPAQKISDKTMSPCVIQLDSNRAFICWMEYLVINTDGYSVATIKGMTWESGDLLYSSVKTYNSDARIDDKWHYRRHFDVVEVDGANDICCFAYIVNSANDVTVKRWDVITPTQTHSATINTASDYSCVAITHNDITNHVAVAYGTEIATGTNYVGAKRFSDSNLTASAERTPILDEATTDEIYSVGISKVNPRGSTTDAYLVAATMDSLYYSSPSNVRGPVTKYTLINSAWSAEDTPRELWNTELIVQPFQYGNRVYIGVNNEQVEDAFSCHALICVNISGATVGESSGFKEPYLAAAWNIGRSKCEDTQDSGMNENYIGTACTAHLGSDNIGRFSVSTVEALNFNATTPGENVQAQRCELDFTAKTRPVKVVDGGVIIPGSVTSWFDGQKVLELGFLSPPYLDKIDVSSGTLSDDFSVLGVWTYIDSLGLVHRSPPGNIVTVTASNQLLTMNYRSLSCTNKRGDGDGDFPDFTTIRSYGSDTTDAKKRLISGPNVVTGNPFTLSWNVQEIVNSIAAAGDRGPTVYTQDFADFEATHPSSSIFATIVRNRCILGGFPESDRIKYSDPLSSDGGERYAPEFFDLFAFESQESKRITGLANLDDKIVFFTSDGVYAIAGDGPDKAGRGDNYSGIVEVSSDYGCINNSSIVETPEGIFFESDQGLCLLSSAASGIDVKYIGEVKTEFEENTCVSADHLPSERVVLFLMDTGSEAKIVCFSYDVGIWYTWNTGEVFPDGNPVAACVHNGEYYIASDKDVAKYDVTTHMDTPWDEDSVVQRAKYKTPWIKAGSLSEYLKTRFIMPTVHRTTDGSGDAFDMDVKVYLDFDESTVVDTFSISNAEAANYDNTSLIDTKIHFVRRCKSFKVELEDKNINHSLGRGMEISSIDFEIAKKSGVYRPSPNHRK